MDAHRRKLSFRAWRRGFREMDLLMGSFADAHLETMTNTELDEFERLLDVPDWEVYAWVVGNTEVPENQVGPVLDQILSFKFAAQPG